jgi:hypothetical protein
LECEVLFLGFGPITFALAKQLIAKGNKVIVISGDQRTFMAQGAELPKELFKMISWSDALNEQINSESTYIGWRKPPQNRLLGPQITSWIKSINLKTGKIHHLSSASVYTGSQDLYSEADYNFRDIKGDLNSKQELEKFVFELSIGKNTNFINYRISNVYGSGLNQGFINESIDNLKGNNPIRIYKKLDLIRDYLLIDDLIVALSDLRLSQTTNETLNISSGRAVAISEIVDQLKTTKRVQFEILEVEAPKETLLKSVLSCKKLEETISWTPKRLEESLEILLKELI